MSVRFREYDVWGNWSGITAEKAVSLTSGDKTMSGILTANSFSGVGSALTSLDWDKIALNKPTSFTPTMTNIYSKTETDNLLSAKQANLTASTALIGIG